MNFMITGKCNYNCLHCFNAADNAPIMTEWTFEEICDLLGQAQKCGIHAFTLTGGEPMLHRNFFDIIKEIYKLGMEVEELNTNGYYINQEILDKMKSVGCRPLIKISFDGIWFHDWLRDRKGAEKRTLDAIELCTKNGFNIMAQTQVNRKNINAVMPTAKILNDMGVERMRLIRTTEVPRWAENALDACLTFEEYFGNMLAFAKDYIKSGMKMDIDIWQMLRIYPKSRSFRITPVACADGEYRDNIPGCRGNRGMIAVTSSGEVVPCMQMSGFLAENNISFGNLHESHLIDIINSGSYLENICMTVGGIHENNIKCGKCPYFIYCTGGCRALGLLFSGKKLDFCGEDITKCYFFENGWYEKVTEILSDWKNLSCMKSENQN